MQEQTLPVIPFSKNWNNKLYCDVFSTIRIKNRKYSIGQNYDIILTDSGEAKKVCTAQIIHIEYYGLLQLPERICLLDTGYSRKDVQKILVNMYKKYGDPNTFTFAVIYLKKIAADSSGMHQD
jgi:hypothetical protein